MWKGFSTPFLHQNYIIFLKSDIKAVSLMVGQILSLMICYIVPISEEGNDMSALYMIWRKAYQSYITMDNESDKQLKDIEKLY